MHWADERHPGWLEAHVEAHVAIAGTVLGVPKSITAVLSGMGSWRGGKGAPALHPVPTLYHCKRWSCGLAADLPCLE